MGEEQAQGLQCLRTLEIQDFCVTNKQAVPTFQETGPPLDGDEEWTGTSLCHLLADSQSSLRSGLCPRRRRGAFG